MTFRTLMSPSVLGRLASSHLVLISAALLFRSVSSLCPLLIWFWALHFTISSSLAYRSHSYSFFLNVSNSSWPSVFFSLSMFHSTVFVFFLFTDVNLSTICTILMLSFSLVLCLSCFLFRRYHLGGYDLRWEAIRWDLHQRYSRSAGEGGAPPSAAHLHNRRLHGHGQMYVFLNRHKKGKQKNETDCILQFVRYSSNFLASIQRLKWKNVWMCSGCFGWANYFRCKQAKSNFTTSCQKKSVLH